MARPVSNLRLFVAAYPPVEVVREVMGVVGAMRLPAHRLTPEGQVHLTLQFIGDRPAREMDEVRESVRRAAAGICGFTLAPRRIIVLPERGPARLIAMETDAPEALTELHQRLAARLAREPHGDDAGRPYRPHMTLARFRAAVGGRLEAEALAAQVLGARIDEAAAFAVTHIELMRSTLSPAGAEHHLVESIALSGR